MRFERKLDRCKIVENISMIKFEIVNNGDPPAG